MENFTEAEDKALVIKKIRELLELLPPVEKFKYDSVLLSMEIQAELTALLSNNVEFMEEELSRARKRKEALKDLLDVNETIEKLMQSLHPEEAEKLAKKAANISNFLKNKTNKSLNEREQQRKRDRQELEEQRAETAKSKDSTTTGEPTGSISGDNNNSMDE